MFDINKAIYEQYKKPISKALQKTMWPSIILTSMVDWNKQIASGIGRITGKDVSSQLESVMGPLGALGYMVPSIMNRILKTKRMAYENI